LDSYNPIYELINTEEGEFLDVIPDNPAVFIGDGALAGQQTG